MHPYIISVSRHVTFHPCVKYAWYACGYNSQLPGANYPPTELITVRERLSALLSGKEEDDARNCAALFVMRSRAKKLFGLFLLDVC